MNTTKLNDLINKENEQREENALRTAKQLITQIVNEQNKIAAAQKQIEECRAELKALEVQQLNATDVLGE